MATAVTRTLNKTVGEGEGGRGEEEMENDESEEVCDWERKINNTHVVPWTGKIGGIA